jgi:hypothetical protein
MPINEALWTEHRRLYPAQYSHPLVGKRVLFSGKHANIEGTVVRVIPSRFGDLVCLDSLSNLDALLASACRVLD